MKTTKQLQASGLPYYDLICIGSGGAGGATASAMADKGWKVAIVEDDLAGGKCPNYSCIPATAFLESSKIVASIRYGQRMGIKIDRIQYNWPQILDFKNQCVRKTGAHTGFTALKEAGIDVYQGHGRFIDANTLNVGQENLVAKYFVVATGSKNYIPEIRGLENNFIYKNHPKASLFLGAIAQLVYWLKFLII